MLHLQTPWLLHFLTLWSPPLEQSPQYHDIEDIVLLLSAVAEYPPEILTPPVPGQTQIEGSSKTLQCQAVANPTPVYSWLHDNTFVAVNKTSSTLRLQNLSQGSSGLYRCLVSNLLGAELSLAAEVKVAGV